MNRPHTGNQAAPVPASRTPLVMVLKSQTKTILPDSLGPTGTSIFLMRNSGQRNGRRLAGQAARRRGPPGQARLRRRPDDLERDGRPPSRPRRALSSRRRCHRGGEARAGRKSSCRRARGRAQHRRQRRLRRRSAYRSLADAISSRRSGGAKRPGRAGRNSWPISTGKRKPSASRPRLGSTRPPASPV